MLGEIIISHATTIPQTPGRKRPPTTASSRRILAEKNYHMSCPDESVFSQVNNMSVASTASYNDFQVLVGVHLSVMTLIL